MAKRKKRRTGKPHRPSVGRRDKKSMPPELPWRYTIIGIDEDSPAAQITELTLTILRAGEPVKLPKHTGVKEFHFNSVEEFQDFLEIIGGLSEPLKQGKVKDAKDLGWLILQLAAERKGAKKSSQIQNTKGLVGQSVMASSGSLAKLADFGLGPIPTSFQESSAVVDASTLEEYANELASIQVGRADAEHFERVTFKILLALFGQHLTDPQLHSRTIGGTQVRDILFFNSSEHPFWAMMRQQHAAKHIVFELKNVSHLQNSHVDQLAGYLTKALGNFGVLVARSEPGDGILRKMVQVYNGHEKIILTLSDSDVIQMFKMKAHGEDPTDIMRRKYVQLTRFAE